MRLLLVFWCPVTHVKATSMKSEQPEDICLDKPLSEVWAETLEILSKKLPLPTFNSWIRPLQLTRLTASEAAIAVRNEFTRERIAKLTPEITNALTEVIGRPIKPIVVVDTSLVDTEYTPSIASITVLPAAELPTQQQTAKPPQRSNVSAVSAEQGTRVGLSNLNPKHLFESFVVGTSNTFSHAAAMAVANKPGQAYNPLFLYGGVGLGKTHLLHAIGNAILAKAPHTVIRYMSCEKFTNDVINSIRDGKMAEFRKRYRQVDLLLMDDIQFIEKKESTQEEFFHTFNHLRDNGKQIVLTSDRPPKALASLEERLRSRFEWGLITDIQAPDYEMRLAILRKKAEQEHLPVPEDVLDYIANSFTSNIRELEGALLRAHAYSSLTGSNLSVSIISSILNPGAPKRKDKAPLTIERLIDTVSAYYHIESADIKSSKRSQDLTVPRHVAMYLAHELMTMSFPRVGQAFGNRKHTSALYAYDKVKEAISKDPAIAEAVREISRQLDV